MRVRQHQVWNKEGRDGRLPVSHLNSNYTGSKKVVQLPGSSRAHQHGDQGFGLIDWSVIVLALVLVDVVVVVVVVGGGDDDSGGDWWCWMGRNYSSYWSAWIKLRARALKRNLHSQSSNLLSLWEFCFKKIGVFVRLLWLWICEKEGTVGVPLCHFAVVRSLIFHLRCRGR